MSLRAARITKGIIGFPETVELSPALISKLVQASLDEMKSAASK